MQQPNALVIVLCLMLATPAVGNASWIGICKTTEAPADTRVLRSVKRPNGDAAHLVVGSQRIAGCDMRELALAPEHIQWATLINSALAQQIRQGVILKAAPDNKNANEIIALREPPATDGGRTPAEFPSRAPGTGNANMRRSLWAWQPDLWRERPDALFGLLERHGARLAFITVPVHADTGTVETPQALSRFIEQATARDISVWAVIGDPAHVLPRERPHVTRMTRAYAAYNADAPSAGRLAGLQLDIEPYLNPGYDLDVEGWLSAYVETLRAIRETAGMPLDVAVPFWWGRQRYRNTTLLEQLTPLVDVVSVMNYRTDRKQVVDFARPFLDWGARLDRKVRLGLEAGPMPDEVMRTFRPAGSGTLWVINLQQQAVLLELGEARPNPSGETYRYSHTVPWRGTSSTFRGHVDELMRLVAALEQEWSRHPAFAGVALHGLDGD